MPSNLGADVAGLTRCLSSAMVRCISSKHVSHLASGSQQHGNDRVQRRQERGGGGGEGGGGPECRWGWPAGAARRGWKGGGGGGGGGGEGEGWLP